MTDAERNGPEGTFHDTERKLRACIEALELALAQSQDIIDRWINTSSEQYQTIVETKEALTQSRAETAAAVAEAHACGEDRAAWKEKAEWAQGQLAVWSNRAITLHTSSLPTPDQNAALDAVRAEARKQGMREAAGIAEKLASEWWSEYKDITHVNGYNPHHQGMSDGADDVATAILAAIKGAKA